jgi:hypothetical protein
VSTLENIGWLALAPEADDELGLVVDEELGEDEDPEAPLAPDEVLGVDDEDVSEDAPLDDEPAAMALAAKSAATMATLVFSMWLTP